MTDLSSILPGARIGWYYESCNPESGPSGHLDIMEGTVLLCNAGPEGRSFWVEADDGRRQMVERSWLLSDEALAKS